MRPLPLCCAFVLGACTTAAVQSTAAPETPAADAPARAASSGAVVPLDRAERRRNPPGTAVVTLLARGENAFLARLEMDPGAAVPEHRDATEEYVHVLEGSGRITIDGTSHEVTAGTTIYMPANALVSFQNGDAPLVGLQVFAGPEPAAKYDAWARL